MRPAGLTIIATAFILTGIGTGCAGAEPSVQGVASVIDGDTLDIHGQRVRLWGVDAPEARQTCRDERNRIYRCGQTAALALDRRIAGRPVRCWRDSVDRYGRMVARCEAGNADLGGWLVRNGFALRYARYSGTAYLVEEVAARRDRAGLWRGDFDAPWTWRQARRRH